MANCQFPIVNDWPVGYWQLAVARWALRRSESGTYENRFGSWPEAIKAFMAWSTDGTLPAVPAAPRKLPPLVSAQLRHAIFKRDGYKCTDCGRSPATTLGLELVVDHILPRISYGSTTYENLRTLCRECNAGKSDK